MRGARRLAPSIPVHVRVCVCTLQEVFQRIVAGEHRQPDGDGGALSFLQVRVHQREPIPRLRRVHVTEDAYELVSSVPDQQVVRSEVRSD